MDGTAADHDGHGAAARSLVAAWLPVFLKGLAMGAADAIPGVSGGTIALIAGIYDRLVGAIAALDPRRLLAVVEAPTGDRVGELRDQLLAMDVHFLVVLGVGVLSGVATVSQVLEFVLTELPLPTFAFFFGLIAASAVVLYGEVSVNTPFRAGAGLVGIVAAFVLVGEFGASVGHSVPVIVLAGAIAISAMLLPGISGSFLLLAMGQLEFMSTNLNEFIEGSLALLTDGSLDRVVASGTAVVAFVAGAAVGVLTIARVVRYALERNREATMTFLVSLMVGALRLPAARVVEQAAAPGDWGLAVVAALVGAALVLGLERTTGEIGMD
jgi:putative membrane protein